MNEDCVPREMGLQMLMEAPYWYWSWSSALRPARGRAPPALESVNDARFVQIVRRHFHLHPITDSQPYEPLAHPARNMCQHLMPVVQFGAEHCARQHGGDSSFDFNRLFHGVQGSRPAKRRGASEPHASLIVFDLVAPLTVATAPTACARWSALFPGPRLVDRQITAIE